MPGQVGRQGTTVRYWFANGSKRGGLELVLGLWPSGIASKQCTWLGLGQGGVGTTEPRCWQRSAGRQESCVSFWAKGVRALNGDDGRQQGSQEGRQASPDGRTAGEERSRWQDP